MNRTQRTTVAIGALIMLTVLGSGWALERAAKYAHSHGRDGGAVVTTPTSAIDTVTPEVTGPSDGAYGGQPSPSGFSLEYDRSDLILSQG